MPKQQQGTCHVTWVSEYSRTPTRTHARLKGYEAQAIVSGILAATACME